MATSETSTERQKWGIEDLVDHYNAQIQQVIVASEIQSISI